MFRKTLIAGLLLPAILLSGCASVDMASKEEDLALKEFSAPTNNMAGVYIYRDTFVGQGLKKSLYIDNEFIGETANKVYFHKLITPGAHKIATESEFSDNSLSLMAKAGINYFIEQYIKIGVFVGGANLRIVDQEQGEKAIKNSKLAETKSI